VTACEVDQEVMGILTQAFRHATQILKENRNKLDRLVEILLQHEEVAGDEVIRIANQAEPVAAD